MFLYLFIILLLQEPGSSHCAVTVSQPPAIAVMLGSSVNLSCLMELNGVNINRINLYWAVRDANNKLQEYLYPHNKARRLYQNSVNDLSVTIDNVQLPFTEAYICEPALLIGDERKVFSGKGTYLLVYEEFTTFVNTSDIICKVKVQAHKNVDLFWESQYQENITSSVYQASDNSYWITSVLANWTQQCRPNQNTTFTCKLRYKQQNLEERSSEVPCPGNSQASHSAQQPILLYVSLLGNSLFILIIIIITFFWMKKKKKRNRRVQINEPYSPLT